MQSFALDFGQWAPDLKSYQHPGLTVANNVYPKADSYSPFQDAVATSDVTTETVAGSAMFFRGDGTFILTAGSSTRLAVRTTGGVTETTGLTALAVDDVWNFERFDDYVIAVTPNNAPQYLTDLDTDTTFSALPGSPPKAAVLGRVNDFLVMGDLTDIDASTRPYRLRWSAFADPTANWVTDRGELSDYRDLDAKYGRITGIVGGLFGLVFQERAIWRMVFVGAPKVFEFEPVAVDRGCIAPGSLVSVGFTTYFLSQDGFYATNGAAIEAIGAGRVDNWFNANVDNARVAQTHGAINWPKQCIIWAFVPAGSATFEREIIYNVAVDRWSSAALPVDYLVKAKTDAVTLADLDASYPGGIGDIPYPLGHPAWLSSSLLMAAWTASGSGSAMAPMNGPALAASFAMGDRQLVPGKRTTVTGVAPVVANESATTTAQIAYRDNVGAVQQATTATLEGADGFCPQKVDARFVAPLINIPAGASWDRASAAQVRARVSGGR